MNSGESCKTKAAQQSVHLTLGILRTSQAVSYALSFFWLDGFAVPAPAQVTQTVGWLLLKPSSKDLETPMSNISRVENVKEAKRSE